MACSLNILVAALAWFLLGRNGSRIEGFATEPPADRIPRPGSWGVDRRLLLFATAAFASSVGRGR